MHIMAHDELLNATEVFRYSPAAQGCQFITIFDGNNPLQQIDLSAYAKHEIVFGRGGGENKVDIGLSSPIVSRRHGRFILSKGQWIIEDTQSTNGILCNGAYIARRELSEGDLYRIDMKSEERADSVLMLVSSALPENGWQDFMLAKDEILIGRSDSCDLVLPHVSVSRTHAALIRRPEGWLLQDRSSGNGILVNGSRVDSQILLHNKDVITIINAKFIFTADKLYYCSFNRGISVDARNIVVKRGKGRKAFITSDHVSMNIRPGELVSIIGGSGAGKSTIMSVLCGYLRPQGGSVHINGIDRIR